MQPYLYEAKPSLLTKSEQDFFSCIQKSVPTGYIVFPQANLATFIQRTDAFRYQNELYRNVDFLVTDAAYKPLFAVEINDQTHLQNKRRDRDEKVKNICEEAGVPIIWLWTSYGVNPDYIQKRINETLASLPVERVHHFAPQDAAAQTEPPEQKDAFEKTSPIKRIVNGQWMRTGFVLAVISLIMNGFPLFSYYVLKNSNTVNVYSSLHGAIVFFILLAIASCGIGILAIATNKKGKNTGNAVLLALSVLGILCGFLLLGLA